MRILVIDGNDEDRRTTSLTLLAENMSLELTDSGDEGVSIAKLYDFDLILLELKLPDMTGFEALRQIRRANVKTPVLILSGMALVTDIVKALGIGADDYLTKPYHEEELIARVNSLVRRSKGLAESVIQTGNIVLNLNTKTVKVDDNPLHLTGKEYQMFELLSLRKGITLSKEAFLTHLYGGMDEPELKIIDVFICKLRKKFSALNGHRIETVWGRGYVLRDADTKSMSMASEVASLVDEPPTGYVPNFTYSDLKGRPGRVLATTGAAMGPVNPNPKGVRVRKGVHIKIPATV